MVFCQAIYALLDNGDNGLFGTLRIWGVIGSVSKRVAGAFAVFPERLL